MEMERKRSVRFCWHCGNKLWGKHHSTHINQLGQELVLHKECKLIITGEKPDTKVDIGEIAPLRREAYK